ncbi:MAG TPA: hypothetical protein VK964_19180 [Nocardioidaceae bacterium]|nr:hypothetical protein [Nocardioidaceae bacterium]
MSRTIRTAFAAALLAVCAALAPTGSAAAAPGEEELPARTEACIRPILASEPSADVIQGWLDGCRLTARSPLSGR